MTDKALVDLMRPLGLFSSLDDEQLDRLSDAVAEVDIPAGKVIIEEGSESRECFVIIEGVAEVSAGGITMDEVGPGDAVGEMALILGWERTATVTAKTPVKAVIVPRDALADNPAISETLTRYLFKRIKDIELGEDAE